MVLWRRWLRSNRHCCAPWTSGSSENHLVAAPKPAGVLQSGAEHSPLSAVGGDTLDDRIQPKHRGQAPTAVSTSPTGTFTRTHGHNPQRTSSSTHRTNENFMHIGAQPRWWSANTLSTTRPKNQTRFATFPRQVVRRTMRPLQHRFSPKGLGAKGKIQGQRHQRLETAKFCQFS